jgi:hypothetical protein
MTSGRLAFAVTAIGATCILASGCLPYVYPKLDYVPSCDVGSMVTDLHAFRVDVTADRGLMTGERGNHIITELTSRAGGNIPPQTRLTVECGFGFFASLIDMSLGRLHATRVRLYRPGYSLIELKPWEIREKVRWEPAPDPVAQEKAIDDLLDRPVISPTSATGPQKKREHPLPTISPETTRVFVFAAAEYERVAALAPTPADSARLRDKARPLVEAKPAAAKRPTPESP